MVHVTPDILLRAYATGLFPMARGRDDAKVYWVDPEQRGVLPLDDFHVPRSLRRTLRRGVFAVTADLAFDRVLAGCAEPTPDRPETWINVEIEGLFRDLHQRGLAHSIEVWRDGALVGGLYGLSMAATFFGESMFSRVSDASKVALCHLVARLRAGGFRLLDTQFITAHLARFGAVEIPRGLYMEQLDDALRPPSGAFEPPPERLAAELDRLSGGTGRN